MTKKIFTATHDFTAPQLTEEGFLEIDAKIARTGIYEYYGFELDFWDKDEDGFDFFDIIKIYRPEDEVFKEDSLKSFENKSITINHPYEAVTANNFKDYEVGIARDIGRDAEFMTARLIIKDAGAINDIQSNRKTKISNGYYAEYDMVAGTTPDGKEYDGVQKNIIGNHIALVDSPRCGSGCSISSDQALAKGNFMSDINKNKHKKGSEMKTVVIDGLEYQIDEGKNPNLVAAITKTQQLVVDSDAEIKVLQKSITDTKSEHDKLVAAKDVEIKKLKDEALTDAVVSERVKEQVTVALEIMSMDSSFTIDSLTDCGCMKREFVEKITGDSMEGKSPDYIDAYYDSAKKAYTEDGKNLADIGGSILRGKGAGEPVADKRRQLAKDYWDNLKNAHKGSVKEGVN